MTDVTVVIPTRDRPALLARAVTLALAQRGVAVQVVVVDDASSDAGAVATAAGGDPRVELLRFDVRRGVSAARNAGLVAAHAPWIAFLDDDDVWHPDWLARIHTAVTAAGAAYGFGPVAFLDRDHRFRGWERCPDPAHVPEGLLVDNVVGVPAQVVLSTEVVRGAGGFDERFSALADWELWLRLRDAPCVAVEEMLVGYSVHPEAMHIRAPRAVLDEFAELQRHTGLPSLDPLRFRRWLAEDCARFGGRRAAASMYRELFARERRPADAVRALRLLAPPLGVRRWIPGRASVDVPPAGERLAGLARLPGGGTADGA